MLVLSRKRGERIIVGDDIVIEVVKIRGRHGHVSIGVEAPAKLTILRGELAEHPATDRAEVAR
jgi:carbon storage regulator